MRLKCHNQNGKWVGLLYPLDSSDNRNSHRGRDSNLTVRIFFVVNWVSPLHSAKAVSQLQKRETVQRE